MNFIKNGMLLPRFAPFYFELNLTQDDASEAKKQLREAKDGLLDALSLPNFVHTVGNKEKAMLKTTSKFVSIDFTDFQSMRNICAPKD